MYGKHQFFEKNRVFEDFDNFKNLPGLNLSIPLTTEYSYLISASLQAKFGRLTPSKNMSFPGEIEKLMKTVGCHIKNDFIFPKSNNILKNVTTSLTKCASICHDDPRCREAWSYELGNSYLIFFKYKLFIIPVSEGGRGGSICS